MTRSNQAPKLAGLMLVLVNTNLMKPPIGPVGLDYVAGAVQEAGVEVRMADLCLAEDAKSALRSCFAGNEPELVGLSFRNVDDCFWPSGAWFVPELAKTVELIRELTDAPLVIGGVGFSIFAEQIVRHTGVEFGIRGDGEQAMVSLLRELRGGRRFDRVDGLLWQEDGRFHANRPAWPGQLRLPTGRDAVDNAAYFRLGGQGGIETKRGCNRQCIYCADPLAKGSKVRLRGPAEIADEVESLLNQGVDVLHTCDSEFNIPIAHALAVCEEFIRRSLGERLRWYAYLAVTPFNRELAEEMRRAGCVGINFTGDSASAAMLKNYRQPHRRDDLARAVKLCRDNRIAVMIDLLLGGPEESPETVAETISFAKKIGPDCAGAALGMRVYPATAAAEIIAEEGPLESNPGIRRHYAGPIDLLKPTFYISPKLGEHPARLVRDLIAGDQRFFEPSDEEKNAVIARGRDGDHNYNENKILTEAIANGARGAYWDILRQH